MESKGSRWAARSSLREGGASPHVSPYETVNTAETESPPTKSIRAPDLRRHQHTFSVRGPVLNCANTSMDSARPHKSASPASDDPQRLRLEILSLRQTISDLKKQTSAAAVTALTLANYEQELQLKDNQLKEVRATCEGMWKAKVRRLEEQLGETQAALLNARGKIEELGKRDKPSGSLYEVIGLLQRENKQLNEELASKMEASQIRHLEEQLQEMEVLQERIIRENQDLRKRLEEAVGTHQRLQTKLAGLNLSLVSTAQDLSQVTDVMRLTHSDTPLTAHVLIQHLAQMKPLITNLPVEEQLEKAVEGLGLTLRELRRLLSEAYTEDCSHICISQ